MDLAQLLDRFAGWTFFFIFGLVILSAFLANWLAPHARKYMHRALWLFAFYALGKGIAVFLGKAHAFAWASRFQFGADLFEAFTVVALVGFVIFDLILPRLRVEIVRINSDIAVGLTYVVTTIAVARSAGMDPSSVLATSAIVSAVLALSLQATLGNILGGVALQLDRSIHVGDFIQIENGRQARVKEIRWRHTVLEMLNGDTIIMPNASLLAQSIILLGKREDAPLKRRIPVYFNVDFRYAPQTVIQVVTEALRASPIANVAADPAPAALCLDLAHDARASFAYYAARYWLTDLTQEDPTSSLVRARIHAALRRHGIPLARPAQTVFPLTDDTEKDKNDRAHERRVAAVNAVELFHGLTAEERMSVVDRLHFTPFCAGETITRQGAQAHWLYLLTTGKVEIRMQGHEGVSRAVSTIEGPNFFGEMGLMTGEARTADVVAVTDVDCYKLERAGFEEILKHRPEVAEGMSKTMARRRVELIAARDGLDHAAKTARVLSEQERILGKIRDFFGLSE